MTSAARGPARAGLFLYAKDLRSVADFYAGLLDLRTVREAEGLRVLAGDGLQLVVHAMPAELAAGVEITTPPRPRDDTALKFFFTVASLAEAERLAPGLGGALFGPVYPGPGFSARNALDPEGNIFQVREFG